MSRDINQEKIIEQIEKFDWNQLSLEKLKLLQSQISKAINFKIQSLEPTKNVNKRYFYQAVQKKVFPHRLHDSLFKYQKCVLGVSLGSNNFLYSERVEASIKWISENFNACVVLVGDSVHRLTIEIREGLNGSDALLKALDTGQEFISDRRLLFEQYSESCRFEFRLTSEIEKQSDFNVYYEELQSLYRKNESFHNLVNSFAQTYLNRGKQVEPEGTDEPDGQKHLAITYLLEESALFACLAKEGWSVFVYPGSIKTFEEISEGLHPEVPEPLQQIIWVSLRLKQKTAGGNENIEEKITR